MRIEFRQSIWSDVGIYALAGLTGAACLWVMVSGEVLALIGVVFAVAVCAAVAGSRMRGGPYLVIDETGVRSPAMQIEIAWDNVKRVNLVYPSRGRTDTLPALAFDLHNMESAGPGAYKPRALRQFMDTFGAPGVYIELSALNAPLSEVLIAVERASPPGTFAPPHYHDPRDAKQTKSA